MIYTSNWISQEIAVARELHKDVWVFENLAQSADFPVLRLDHFMLCDLGSKQHQDYIEAVITSYDPIPQLITTAIGTFIAPGPGTVIGALVGAPKRSMGIEILCPACAEVYRLHSDITRFKCPACRVLLERRHG